MFNFDNISYQAMVPVDLETMSIAEACSVEPKYIEMTIVKKEGKGP